MENVQLGKFHQATCVHFAGSFETPGHNLEKEPTRQLATAVVRPDCRERLPENLLLI